MEGLTPHQQAEAVEAARVEAERRAAEQQVAERQAAEQHAAEQLAAQMDHDQQVQLQPSSPSELQRLADLINENDHLAQALRRERKRLEALQLETTSIFALEP